LPLDAHVRAAIDTRAVEKALQSMPMEYHKHGSLMLNTH